MPKLAPAKKASASREGGGAQPPLEAWEQELAAAIGAAPPSDDFWVMRRFGYTERENPGARRVLCGAFQRSRRACNAQTQFVLRASRAAAVVALPRRCE